MFKDSGDLNPSPPQNLNNFVLSNNQNVSDSESDDDIIEFQPESSNVPEETSLDADSIVGGESISSETIKESELNNKFNLNQKIFSFQLPFGGKLSLIKQEIMSHFTNFSLFRDEEELNLKEDIRLKLTSQESINTLSEADYFRRFKGRDDVRFRAVKHSLANKYNEINPLHSNHHHHHHHHHPSIELPDYESIYSRIDGNIVILGGYRGSVLRDTMTRKRIWIPIKAGFNLRRINLLLGPNEEDELNASRAIFPDGVLKNIGPVDICKTLIKKLDLNPQVNIKEFGYDWRLSGNVVSEQLETFLLSIVKETGKPVMVISHSMGGLIAHRVLQRSPDLFRSLIYVGVPSECLNILGPIRFGDPVLFLDRILTPESNFMMRSSFHFLPLSGRVFYNKTTNECYPLDLFNPDTWVEYNLNPLVSLVRARAALQMPESRLTLLSPTRSRSNSRSSTRFGSLSPLSPLSPRTMLSRSTKSPSPSSSSKSSLFTKLPSPPVETQGYSVSFEQAYDYLARTLAKVKQFILALDYNPDLEPHYPPMAIVYGNTVPSVRGSHVSSEEDIKDGNYYNFFYGHGDGVVHQKWLMPERKGFEYYDVDTGKGQIVGKFSSQAGHVNLMTDLKAMGEALNAVYEAEKVWK